MLRIVEILQFRVCANDQPTSYYFRERRRNVAPARNNRYVFSTLLALLLFVAISCSSHNIITYLITLVETTPETE